MLLIYCGIALLPDAARTQRNMMAVIFLVAATFTVLSFGSFFVKKKNLTIMVSVFLIAGICLIFIISILMKKIICQNSLSREKHWINWRQGQILQS